jgi:outer membrane scaffolding protein for murein synthesis (MipA/OmpV family)
MAFWHTVPKHVLACSDSTQTLETGHHGPYVARVSPSAHCPARFRRASVLRVLAIVGLASLAAPPATAQQLLDVAPGAATEGPAGQRWTFTIGAIGAIRPAYEGSDAYLFSPLPVVDIRYRDIFFASARDGIGVNVIRTEWLKLAPVLRYRFGRDQDDNRALFGMGDVSGTIEGGVLATFGPGPLRLRLEAAQGLNGDGHQGFQARADLTYGTRLGERIFVAGGPSVTYADRQFHQSYFGVSPEQSARSGYAPFSAEAGFKDIGFSVNGSYRLWGSFTLTAVAELKQLLGDAADSPIVRDETQAFFGLGITWRGGL